LSLNQITNINKYLNTNMLTTVNPTPYLYTSSKNETNLYLNLF